MNLSTVQQSTPKLRSSCDACGEAKTRCDRSRPQCGRCIGLNLSCGYSPSRQFGKRPRRKLRALRHVAPQLEVPTDINGYETIDMDGLGVESDRILPEAVTSSSSSSSFENTHFDPTQFDPGYLTSLSTNWLEFNNTENSNDTLFLDLAKADAANSPDPPHTDFQWDRIYQEPNEILQSLTVHRDTFSPEKVLIEMSRVLEANKTAIQCVSEFLKRDCARKMPHLTMLYMNIVARVLLWYQNAAGFDLFKSRNSDPSSVEPVGTGITPPTDTSHGPMAYWTTKCFAIHAQTFSVGNFNVDEPCMQLAFKNQLLCHEVRKVGAVIDELIALAADERVAAGDRAMYSALGVWLKSEHEKTLKVFKDTIRRTNEKLGI